MAQEVPAPPKSHRLRMLARAALFGPDKALRRRDLLASERAALAWRQAPGGRPAEEVVFALPLVARAQVGNWAEVTARLGDTLASFLRQTDPRWRAVICCQQRPEMPAEAEGDPRIMHLPFDDPDPGNDKWPKLGAIARHLGATLDRPAFAMSFDADDLLRPGAVAAMLAHPGADGWRVDDGLILNAATGTIGQAGARSLAHPLRKPFWKLCGSCAAYRIDPDLPEGPAALAAFWQHEHRVFPYLARLAGRPLRALDGGQVLYIMNHGENFSTRLGHRDFKHRFVERFAVRDTATLAHIRADFDL